MTLVFQVIDELGILSIFPSESLLQLKVWGVNGDRSVPLEDRGDLAEDVLTYGHLIWCEITSSLGNLRLFGGSASHTEVLDPAELFDEWLICDAESLLYSL